MSLEDIIKIDNYLTETIQKDPNGIEKAKNILVGLSKAISTIVEEPFEQTKAEKIAEKIIMDRLQDIANSTKKS